MIDDAVKVTLRGKTFLVSKEAYDALGEEFLDLVLEEQGYWEAEERYQKRKRDDELKSKRSKGRKRTR